MPNKKVYVVTGGNGFIGSHMCKHLCKLGHEVHIIDNLSTSGPSWGHRYGICHQFDISDSEKVRKLFGSLNVECVFHFAAKSLVEESEGNPFLYYRENFSKTLSLLESCYLENIKNFVFSSTCAVFGLPLKEKLDEDHIQQPLNTYGQTKKLIELMMRDLSAKGMINILILRYFNAAGCDPEGELGENHQPETHLIPNLCHAYLSEGLKRMQIYGADYPTRDGTCIRDYIHVEDLVTFHYAGANYLKENPGLHDFNLGSENGHTVKEVITAFEKMIGSSINSEIRPRRAGDAHCLIGDSFKAKKLLKIQCRYSLEDSLKHTFNWIKKWKNK